MALLDIDPDLIFQTVAFQEAVYRGDVVIILMFCRLLRFRLDQDRAGETDPVLVFDNHVQKSAKLVHFLTDVGVQQRFIALTATPQDIVLATKTMRGVNAAFHRRGRIGHHLRVWVGGGTRHEAAMAEQIGRTP